MDIKVVHLQKPPKISKMSRPFLISCLVLSLIIFCQTGCSAPENECSIDSTFSAEYLSKIEYLSDVASTGLIDGSQLTHSVIYFEDITFIEGHLVLGHYPSYESMNQLNSDIAKWNDWYEQNKCGMTKVKADSLLKLQTISGRPPK